jgi:hypothetical protein
MLGLDYKAILAASSWALSQGLTENEEFLNLSFGKAASLIFKLWKILLLKQLFGVWSSFLG